MPVVLSAVSEAELEAEVSYYDEGRWEGYDASIHSRHKPCADRYPIMVSAQDLLTQQEKGKNRLTMKTNCTPLLNVTSSNT